ncbi:unnamed protein product [marine sediment metagenome]|uniref:Glycosyl transferase family 1 domain-containing protein n=1 Tax=marine sediment metagenome TaxID=412755 RepID=X0YVJ0_9ZZZZ
MPVESIFAELGINAGKSGYIIKNEPISELLKSAKIVLVGISSVALEALASECIVILLVFSNVMFMSPLDGFDEFGIKVYSPAQLSEAVKENIRKAPDTREKTADFINRYWCLDEALTRWERVLE